MSGRENRFGHPHSVRCFAGERAKIWRTDEDGVIVFNVENDVLE